MSEIQPLSNGPSQVIATLARRAGALLGGNANRGQVRQQAADATGAVDAVQMQPKDSRFERGGHRFNRHRSTSWQRGQPSESKTERAVPNDDSVARRRVVITNLCTERLSLSATSHVDDRARIVRVRIGTSSLPICDKRRRLLVDDGNTHVVIVNVARPS